jgi:hypothetical protein
MASAPLPNFPGLAGANSQANKAIMLLETAAHNLTHYLDDESDCLARAQRMRGAAILAMTAVLELMNAAGWHEAACAAVVDGLLDD